MNEQRDKFEAWAEKAGYPFDSTDDAFIVWQAALAQRAASVPKQKRKRGFDMSLRESVQQMTLALNENEWAGLLTTDPDATALEEAIRSLLARSGQLQGDDAEEDANHG